MPFQGSVNQQPAPAVAGDFADTNPRHSVPGGPTGLVCGTAGVTVGNFGWVDTATGTIVNNFGAGAPTGFVHNSHQALITTYLGETSLVVPAGFMMGDLFDGGTFWAKNNSTTTAQPGQKIFVSNATGSITALAAAGTAQTSGNISGNITPATFSTTAVAAITPTNTGPGTNPAILNVTVVGSGAIYPGAVIAGTGVQAGTIIVNQINGTPGGVGNYTINPPQNIANTTVTGTYGNLTVSVLNSGTVTIGQPLTGGNATAGTTITAQISGTPNGVGSYAVNPTQTTANITAGLVGGAVESAWFVANGSFGAPGELIKITSKYP